MSKIIRPKYPIEFSVGVILLIGTIAGFLSPQIFDRHGINKDQDIYPGMILVSIAVIIMVVIIWEEILFPVKLKEVDGSIFFGNHKTKLKAQALIYCIIPAIFLFIYLEYEVNHMRFFVWAAVCMIAPVIEKIISGINNYNDFLKLSNEKIEYKNNEKEGCFEIKDIKHITIIKDNRNVFQKLELFFTNNDESIIIDLDEMELEAFYDAIYNYMVTHYIHLLK
jgi:hypothetical protein